MNCTTGGWIALRRAAALIAGASAALHSLACSGADAEEEAVDAARPSYCLPGPPSIEVGTGSPAYMPIESGAAVPIIAGPQGGVHILLSARTRGLGPTALIEYGANDEATGELLTWQGLRQILPLKDKGEGGEVIGLTAFLSEKDPAINAGRKAILWLIVTDDCSPPARGEILATLAEETP